MEVKNENLNWQALEIEETQGRLKEAIKDMLLDGANFETVARKVKEIVSKCVESLKSESLKQSVGDGLLKFASRTYTLLKETFGDLGRKEIFALSMFASGDDTPRNTEIVREIAIKELGVEQYEWGLPLNIYAKDYMKLVEQRINELAKLEAKEDYTSNLSLRNLAEIQVRLERHEDELREHVKNGENLVWIVPHENCSERCLPFQGKLYSLDGTSGVVDGIAYKPIESATDIYETTKSGKIYKNGCLSGFNCRHTTTPYKKGVRPVAIPKREIDTAREIDKKQRYLERGVRAWKDKALLYKGIDTKKFVYSRAKAKEWNERYIEFSKENKVAYYPDRTKIL